MTILLIPDFKGLGFFLIWTFHLRIHAHTSNITYINMNFRKAILKSLGFFVCLIWLFFFFQSHGIADLYFNLLCHIRHILLYGF